MVVCVSVTDFSLTACFFVGTEFVLYILVADTIAQNHDVYEISSSR